MLELRCFVSVKIVFTSMICVIEIYFLLSCILYSKKGSNQICSKIGSCDESVYFVMTQISFVVTNTNLALIRLRPVCCDNMFYCRDIFMSRHLKSLSQQTFT